MLSMSENMKSTITFKLVMMNAKKANTPVLLLEQI
jgi:hypothetical protein